MPIKRLLFPLVLILVGPIAEAEDGPWTDGFSPPPGKYTWIQLESDEWLKGEIISLYEETLRFDSDHLGDLQIDLEDIRQLYGSGEFEVTFLGQDSIRGEVQIRDQQVLLIAGGKRYERSRSEVIAIIRSAEREWDRWSGDISFGLNVRRGNAEISESNVSASFTRRTPVSRLVLDYLGATNETEGERITNSHRINLGLDRFSGGRFFWRPITLQYYQDRIQNIKHQATVDSGIGYRLVDSPRVEWEVTGGVGANFLQNESVAEGDPEEEVSPVGTLGSDLTIELTSWMDYELLVDMKFLNEKSGQYQHHVVSNLSTDLIGNIDLDVGFIWDRTEKPQERTDNTTPEQDDFRVQVSVSYDF